MKISSMILSFMLYGALGTAPVRAQNKVAYLGVATVNVDEAAKTQLGLTNGVTVVDVRDDGPSAGILEKHDILTRMDDQMLFNPEQLTSLLASKKKGDRVGLAVVRKGQHQTKNVTLGEREGEKISPGGPAISMDRFNIDLPEVMPAEIRRAFEDALKNGGGGANSSARVIINGREVTVPGNGAQAFAQSSSSHSSSSTVWSDGQHTYQIVRNNGKTTVKVTEDGRIVHEGPFDTQEDRKKFPRKIREKLEEIDTKVGVPAADTDQKKEKRDL